MKKLKSEKQRAKMRISIAIFTVTLAFAQKFDAVDGGFVPGNPNLIWFTKAKYTGIFLWDGEKVDTITTSYQSGFRPAFMLKNDTLYIAWRAWLDDMSWIEFTTRPGTRVRKVSKPSRKTGVPVWTNENLLFTRDDVATLVDAYTGDVFSSWYGIDAHIVLWSKSGLIYINKADELILYNFAGEENKLTPKEVRAYGPILSPDGNRLIINCLGTPDYIMNMTTQELTRLPEGDEFRFDCDGKRIIFMMLKDDGEEIVSGDVKVIENNKTAHVNPFWGEKIPVRADICGGRILVITNDGEIIVDNLK